MKEQTLWQRKTSTILHSVVFFVIATAAYLIIPVIFGKDVVMFNRIWEWAMPILSALIAASYIWYYAGLRGFRKILPQENQKPVCMISTGVLLLLVAILFSLIPRIGAYLMPFMRVAAYMMIMWGFLHLSKSESFPAAARKGAYYLLLAYTVYMILTVFNFLSGLYESSSKLTYYILLFVQAVKYIIMIKGWRDIRNAVPGKSATIE